MSNAQYKSIWAELKAVDRQNGDCLYCPLCGAPITMKQWMAPRKIKLSKPQYPDCISYWAGDGVIVSERFKKVYEKSKLKGIALDWSKWGGEDIFRLHDLGGTYFITQRFVDFCKQNEFTNFNFILSSNYTFGIKKTKLTA